MDAGSNRVGQTRPQGLDEVQLPNKGAFGRFQVNVASTQGLNAGDVRAEDVGIDVKDTRSLGEWLIDSFWSLLGWNMSADIEHDKNEALIGLVASGISGDGTSRVDLKDRVCAFEMLFGSKSTATTKEQQEACVAMMQALDNQSEEVSDALLGRIKGCIGNILDSPAGAQLQSKIDALQVGDKSDKIAGADRFGVAVAAFRSIVTAEKEVADSGQKENACGEMLSAVNKERADLDNLERLNALLDEVSLDGPKAAELKEAVTKKIGELKVAKDLEALAVNPDAEDANLNVLDNVNRFNRICSSEFATDEQKGEACEKLAGVLSSSDSNAITELTLEELKLPPSGLPKEARSLLAKAVNSVRIDHDIHVISSGRNKDGSDASVEDRILILSGVLTSKAASPAQKDRACQAIKLFVDRAEPGAISAKDLGDMQEHIQIARGFGHKTEAGKEALKAIAAFAGRSAEAYSEQVQDGLEDFLNRSAEEVIKSKGGLDAYQSKLEQVYEAQENYEAFAGIGGKQPEKNPRLEYMFKSAEAVKKALESAEMRDYIEGQDSNMQHDFVAIERQALRLLHNKMKSSVLDDPELDYRSNPDPADVGDGMRICKGAFELCESGETKGRVSVAKPGEAPPLEPG